QAMAWALYSWPNPPFFSGMTRLPGSVRLTFRSGAGAAAAAAPARAALSRSRRATACTRRTQKPRPGALGLAGGHQARPALRGAVTGLGRPGVGVGSALSWSGTLAGTGKCLVIFVHPLGVLLVRRYAGAVCSSNVSVLCGVGSRVANAAADARIAQRGRPCKRARYPQKLAAA